MATADSPIEPEEDRRLRTESLQYAFQKPEEDTDVIATAQKFYNFLTVGNAEDRALRSQSLQYAMQRPDDELSVVDRAKAFFAFLTGTSS